MMFSQLCNFFTRSEYDPDTGCINYTGPIGSTGYGEVTTCDGVKGNPHKIVFVLYNRMKVPEGRIVKHECNNSRCIHPLHLILGTYSDNNLDMYKAGRRTNCLLGHEVLAIRQAYHDTNISQLELATKYGTVEQSIRKILKGESYNWLHNVCKDKYEQLTARRALSKLGEGSANSKLTSDKVKEIRRLKETVKISNMTLARRFGVSDRTIEDILHRRTWKHI